MSHYSPRPGQHQHRATFSPRDLDVERLRGEGLTHKQIGERLRLSRQSVRVALEKIANVRSLESVRLR